MRKLELNEIKAIQLEILDDFDAFCKKKGLKYSLGGGTLLGAVRHKGYIPWDDDIDVAMPRGDYEKFILSYKSDVNKVVDLRRNDSSSEVFVKIVRVNTFLRDCVFGRVKWGVFIDVFPIDNCPEDYGVFCLKLKKKRDLLSGICAYYRDMDKPRIRLLWFIKYIFKRLVLFYPHSILYLKKEIDDTASEYSHQETRFAGAVLGAYYSREVTPASVFKSFSDICFEGKMYQAITDYDTYLKSLYGDYMTLPPEEERVTHHLYDAYIID